MNKYEDRSDYPYDEDDEMFAVASYTECTGLIQIPPRCEEDSESYGDIYSTVKREEDGKK